MSMFDAFFSKGFKAAKCKTLLKLSMPRIKLLRNKREVQIKQMRKDIAKLLETGQEATARIRVEHVIREENMIAAQEIIELFCELVSVRLPIIETQRECPLDLKEAISSVCFAAPRCADLPELQQVQVLFAMKYGKEFVSAATELVPSCGVNRQLIELLSVRAPSPDVKLKLLKEIAEEHQLDWDSAASETEFFKPHEDLLNGPTQFVSGSKLPLPEGKHVWSSHYSDKEDSSIEEGFDPADFPEVPKVPLKPNTEPILKSEVTDVASPSSPSITIQEQTDIVEQTEPAHEDTGELLGSVEKQSSPFINTESETKGQDGLDLQDVLAAAQAAAESAERAAAAARSAATLAEVKISEFIKNRQERDLENAYNNPFHPTADSGSPPSSVDKFDSDEGQGGNLPFDEEQCGNVSFGEGQGGNLPFDEGQGGNVSFGEGQRGYLAFDQGEGCNLPFGHGQGSSLVFNEGQGGNLPFDQGQGGNLPFDQGHGGNLAFDHGQGSNLVFDEGQGGNLPFHQGQSGKISFDEGQGCDLAFDQGPRGNLDFDHVYEHYHTSGPSSYDTGGATSQSQHGHRPSEHGHVERSSSMEDDSFFSYPNLFKSEGLEVGPSHLVHLDHHHLTHK